MAHPFFIEMGFMRFYVSALALGSLSQCVDPTEIILSISTNAGCPAVENDQVLVGVGPPGDDQSGVVAAATTCDPDGGTVGTLVVVPSAGVDGFVGLRVMLSTSGPSQACDLDASTCIVARRALRYSPHTPLHLPIALDTDCLGKACDPSSTCYAGACVEAGVVCTSGTCELPDAAPSPACQAFGPVSLGAAWLATPRIARIGGGWAVAWVDASGTSVVGSTVSEQGKLGSPVAITASGGFVAGDLGPLGSDGARLAVMWNGPTVAEWAVVGIDGGSPYQTGISSMSSGPSSGFFYSGPAAGFVTAVLTGTSTVWFVAKVGQQYVGQIDAGNPISTARAPASRYYVTSIENGQSCQTDVYDEGAAGVLTYASSLPTVTSCQSARVAPTASGDYIRASEDVSGRLSVDYSVGGTSSTVTIPTSVAGLWGFVPLATGSTPFRLLWVDQPSASLLTNTYPNPAPTPTTLPLSGAISPQKNGGFDAVADAPSASTGYAIVYVTGTSSDATAWVQHFCP